VEWQDALLTCWHIAHRSVSAAGRCRQERERLHGEMLTVVCARGDAIDQAKRAFRKGGAV